MQAAPKFLSQLSRILKSPRSSVLFSGVVCLVFPASAHAYLDPGTGGFLIQILIAFLIGMLVTVKSTWIYVKSFLSGIFMRQNGKKKGD